MKDRLIGLGYSAGWGLIRILPETVDQLYAAMVATGHGADDHSGVVQVIEALSRPGP